ncbi:hypothetical protein [Pseudomonas silesiensis]
MFALAPFIMLLVLLTIFHWYGYCTRGTISKTSWKVGDYIWLAMACFALVGGSYDLRKAISADVIAEVRQSQLKNFVLKIENTNVETFALLEEINSSPKSSDGKLSKTLLDIASQSKEIDARIASDSNLIKKAESEIDKNHFEKTIVYFYPFILAIALSLRITMTSAEVFNWHQNDTVPKNNDSAQKFDADQSAEEFTAKYESIENNDEKEDAKSLKPIA